MKERTRLILAAVVGSTALAFGLIPHPPAGFFMALRFVVCFVCAYLGWASYRARHEGWTWLLGGCAALYNPFLPVHLSTGIWLPVNVLSIALLAGACWRLARKQADATAPRVAATSASVGASPSPDAGQPSAETNERPRWNSAREPSAPVAPVKPLEYNDAGTAESIFWFVIACLFFATVFMSTFGSPSTSPAGGTTTVGWTLGAAFWFFIIARIRRFRRPGRLALYGFLISFLTLVAGYATSAYYRGKEQSLAFEEAWSTIKRNAPELPELKDDTFAAKLRPAISRMIARAPDRDVIAFSDARISLVGAGDKLNVTRCAAMARAQPSPEKMSTAETLLATQAMANLFEAGGTHPDDKVNVDTARIRGLLAPIYAGVDPQGLFDGDVAKIPDRDLCDMYLKLMAEIRALPVHDAAEAVRYVASFQQ